jgi:1,4-alpha-glucan branching enzyme
MVSRPTSVGGLGFGMKWMMGWMHDTLEYFQKVYRKYHQNELTFSSTYAFQKILCCPFHMMKWCGKNLLGRMPVMNGKFANLIAITICLCIQELNYCLWDVNLDKVPNGILKVVLIGI